MISSAARPTDRTVPTRRRTQRALAALVVGGLVAVLAQSGPAVAAPATPAGPTSSDATRGRWSVARLDAQHYRVSWRSPTDLPVTSDRPTVVGPAGLDVGTPTVATDGRTVQAVVTTRRAPHPRTLDVVLSGDRLDVAGQDRDNTLRRGQSAAEAPTAAQVEALATDPGVPGPYAVTSSDYTRAPVKVANMEQPIEMVGHVVEPVAGAATGPRPLVLFLHGRHSYCYLPGKPDGEVDDTWPCKAPAAEIPSQLGYDYVQRLMASQGFTTVSIRVNGINAQDGSLEDAGMDARATLVRKHLDYWAGIAAQHQVDLGKVVLIGHSRGGEGVDRASIQIPLSAPYRIVGQVLVAPTDFADQTAPYVPTVTLLPYCDGDVSDLQGQHFTDLSRDLTSDDTSLKSSVLVMGANHNFFNTEWTPGVSKAPSFDDWYGADRETCGTKNAGRLSAQQQRAVGQAYLAGAVQLFTRGDQADLPLFDGTRTRVASAGSAVVLSHAIGGGRDVRRPGNDASRSLPDGATTSFCRGATSGDYAPGVCGVGLGDRITPHWQDVESGVPVNTFLQVAWTAAGQSGGVVLDRSLDLRDRTLDLRTIVDPAYAQVKVKVRLTDASGSAAVLTPVGGTALAALPGGSGVAKLWAQDLRVDPSSAAGLDLAQVVRVDLVADSAKGRVWVADLSAATNRLAAVPSLRVPTVSLGRATVKEGNASGWTTAQVPFTLSGPLPRPAQFAVVTVSDAAVRRFTVDLAAGQTRGSIPVAYEADRLDDLDEAVTSAHVWATRNLMTDRYLGELVVRDDDPTPSVRVTRVKTTIDEGAKAQWKVELAAPVGYDASVVGRVVKGSGIRLNGRDVPLSWFRDYADPSKRGKALDQLGIELYAEIAQGGTETVLTIPTSKDKTKEGNETVTLEVEALTTKSRSTITVNASR